MKKSIITIILIHIALLVKSQDKYNPTDSIAIIKSTGLTSFSLNDEHTEFSYTNSGSEFTILIDDGSFIPALCIHCSKNKLIANKPYTVKMYNLSLIVYKNGKKVDILIPYFTSENKFK